MNVEHSSISSLAFQGTTLHTQGGTLKLEKSGNIKSVEQSLLAKILAKLSIAIIVVALADLVYLNWLVLGNKSVRTEKQEASSSPEASDTSPSPTPSSAEATEGKPAEETKTVETRTIVEKETQTIVQTAQKEIFIPMGSGATKSHDFADLTSTDVTIDTSKYASIQSIVFESSIWVEGGNGAAYAQLYNVSDKTGYIESQISNNTGTAVVKTSGNLPLPSGQKTYRVRAKTDIVEFAAQVSNARIKITLK